jgi:prepilin-type processing-associated H-X9-DG protein
MRLTWRIPASIIAPEAARASEWHDQEGSHNLAYLDGHAAFTRLRRGAGASSQYAIMPFAAVDSELQAVQDGVPLP